MLLKISKVTLWFFIYYLRTSVNLLQVSIFSYEIK